MVVIVLLVAVVAGDCSTTSGFTKSSVTIYEKPLKIPTYQIGGRVFEAALEYPENLEVARPHHGGRDCEIYYLLGNVYDEWKPQKRSLGKRSS